MKCIKLTDADAVTRAGHPNACQWGPGVRHEATGTGTSLCTDRYIHAYPDREIAALMHPMDITYGATARWWEADGEGEPVAESPSRLKLGFKALTTLREIEPLRLTTEQRVAAAILLARPGCDNPDWNRWADAWLSGKDRSARAARSAEAVMAGDRSARAVLTAEVEAAVWVADAAAEAAAAEEGWVLEAEWAEYRETWVAEAAGAAAEWWVMEAAEWWVMEAAAQAAEQAIPAVVAAAVHEAIRLCPANEEGGA